MSLTNISFVQEFAELAREIFGASVVGYKVITSPLPDDSPVLTFGLLHETGASLHDHIPLAPDFVLAHDAVASSVVEHLIHELGHAFAAPEWVDKGESATRYEFRAGERAAQAFAQQVCVRMGWTLKSETDVSQWEEWHNNARWSDNDKPFVPEDWTWEVWQRKGDAELAQFCVKEEHYELVVAFFRRHNFPPDLILVDNPDVTIVFPEAT